MPLVTKDFMGKAAPMGYVAGVGRGASGFVTRSDIGPMDPMALSSFAGGDDEDNFGGEENEAGLLSNLAPYDQEDLDADTIYASVNQKMDERRRVRREAREQKDLKNYRKSRPKIQQQFEDIKRTLKDVTEDEWESIPEVSSIKKPKKENPKERFTPVPDNLLLSARSSTEYVGSLDTASGFTTPSGTSTPLTDFRSIGEAREKQLGHRLDTLSESRGTQSSVDPSGYLTGLNSLKLKSSSEMGDIKKALLLLKSLVTTHPDHPSGWVSLTRLLEEAGKTKQAQETILEATVACSSSEDVWLEACRLSPGDASALLTRALTSIPHSVKLWLKAIDLEGNDVSKRKKVLRRALEQLPNSITLWKFAVELEEEPENARILLAHAVECVPSCIDLWLALAKLESYENARRVLNKARSVVPTSHEIWLAAAALEEANGSTPLVSTLVNRGVAALAMKGVHLSRDVWIKEAYAAETTGNTQTCSAIISATIGLDIDEPDRKVRWLEDAETATSQGFLHTARSIYQHTLGVFPDKKSIWKAAVFFERAHGSREQLLELLHKAVQAVPHAEVLWLLAAKEKWMSGDLNAARLTLASAFESNPNSEQIWLAAVKLESENNEIEKARTLLSRAREQSSTPRVWMKFALLERSVDNLSKTFELLQEGIQLFPGFAKFYMILGSLYERQYHQQPSNPELVQKARAAYSEGCRHCPNSAVLWILAAKLEETQGSIIKVRAILDNARKTNPKNPELWLASARLEAHNKNNTMAKTLILKGLHECPISGILWAESIILEPRPSQKSRGTDALRKCPDDPHITLVMARLFWSERKLEKAKAWFERSLQLDPDLGDSWGHVFAFEKQYGNEESTQSIIQRCKQAEPRHGDIWASISKNPDNAKLTLVQILELVASSCAPL